MDNIYPILKNYQTRAEKEALLGQRGITIWFTGLSGSGKSCVSAELEKILSEHGRLCTILDGDNVRAGLNSDLGFSLHDRKENIRRIAEVCKLFNNTGIITIASFVSPTAELRRMAREIIGPDDFFEVYMSTPISECERRDVKGLYARARKGEVQDFTGISAPFEVPQSPDIVIDTTGQKATDCALRIYGTISGRIALEVKNDEYEESCL